MTQLVVNPGRVARRNSGALRHTRPSPIWPSTAKTTTSATRLRRFRLRTGFRVPEAQVSRWCRRDGRTAAPLIARCQHLTHSGAQRVSEEVPIGVAGRDSAGRRVPRVPRLLPDPVILGVGADYLGELPILATWSSGIRRPPMPRSQTVSCTTATSTTSGSSRSSSLCPTLVRTRAAHVLPGDVSDGCARRFATGRPVAT